ncbi:MAG TPA: hypothetical protein VGA20_05485 [Gemmatimonadales bacterium]
MKPLVAEVVGVWGAGKSALVSSIKAADRSIQVPLALWALPTVELLRGGVQALITIGGLFRAAGGPRWKEARLLARLRALHRELQSQIRQGSRVVLFDEGPAVLLSWLRGAAHQTAGNGGPAAWWPKVLAEWAGSLDLVVFLDAPNPVLAHRIRTRSQRHPLKHKSDAEISGLLEHHRAAYSSVLTELQAFGGPAVLSFRSDQQSIAEITEGVLATFEQRATCALTPRH